MNAAVEDETIVEEQQLSFESSAETNIGDASMKIFRTQLVEAPRSASSPGSPAYDELTALDLVHFRV